MYQYDEHDQKIIDERVAQYRHQTERYLAGELAEEEYLPLRLQNGLYVQKHAPMMRIAVPYGLLNSDQLRKLAEIARKYDKSYTHVTTRQNFQLNWPTLESTPDILAELASVQMHAVQTSGNCIRNTTTDPYAGVAQDQVVDSRPYCELIRQWSTFHPEFAFLPRKFKIAVNGAKHDRAAILAHDIGLQAIRTESGEIAFDVFVGGGLGRTPIAGKLVRSALPEKHLLSYLEAVLRVYNQRGRRDNKYKARIKILVRALGVEEFTKLVEAEWATLKDGHVTLTEDEIARAQSFFQDPAYEALDIDASQAALDKQMADNADFAQWVRYNVTGHKQAGYAIVNLTLKATGTPPGDITSEGLDGVAALADAYSFGEARTTHEQNMVLADVKQSDLLAVWEKLKPLGFATPNLNFVTDIICCPGGDFCNLANAQSIPIAQALQERFDDMDYVYDLGELHLNISGCMNACGHHHIGNIGILGVDKKGAAFYQVSIGGDSVTGTIGKILGPSFAMEEMADVVEKVLEVYVEKREEDEPFLQTYERIGIEPFKERVYATAN